MKCKLSKQEMSYCRTVFLWKDAMVTIHRRDYLYWLRANGDDDNGEIADCDKKLEYICKELKNSLKMLEWYAHKEKNPWMPTR